MTPADLAAIVRVVGPVVRDYVAAGIAVITTRVGGLEQRLVTVETKAAAPPAPASDVVTHVDLQTVMADVGAMRAHLDELAAILVRCLTAADPLVVDLRDRLIGVEAKTAIPPPVPPPAPDLSPLVARLDAADTHLSVVPAMGQALVELRERLSAMEMKAAGPDPNSEFLARLDARTEAAVVGLRRDVGALETRLDADARRLEGYTAALQRDAAALGERVAVVEVRAQVPGPAGKDGLNGKDGVDGVGFEHLDGEYDEHGRLSLRFATGDREKRYRVHGHVDRGVWKAGVSYLKGDGVTWGGAYWIAQQDTDAKPGEHDPESRAWRLAVKKGQEGSRGAVGLTGPQGPQGPKGTDGRHGGSF